MTEPIVDVLAHDHMRLYLQHYKPGHNVFDAVKAQIEAAAHEAEMSGGRVDAHSDDIAVDKFAAAMKAKLADARAKGRGGWETCGMEFLQESLFKHMAKGDPRDVANFCMMLWNREEATAYEDQWVYDLTGRWPGVAAIQRAESPEACPNAEHMGEHACSNRSQCWEPCGELGKSAEHVRVAQVEPAANINARRYERLRILGCAPMGHACLSRGTVLRFQTLDEFVDDDVRRHPSRGEAEPAPEHAQGGAGKVCRWTAHKHGGYHSDCGRLLCSIQSGAVCQYCGGKIVEVKP